MGHWSLSFFVMPRKTPGLASLRHVSSVDDDAWNEWIHNGAGSKRTTKTNLKRARKAFQGASTKVAPSKPRPNDDDEPLPEPLNFAAMEEEIVEAFALTDLRTE